MFSSFLRASLAALVASAVAVSAAPAIIIDVDLTVMLSLPDSKGDGSENVKVVTTVANTGNKPVQLLEDPRGVLRYFPEDSFIITGPADSHPSFNGARAKYSPNYAAGLEDSYAYTSLAPGDQIDVTHDLTKAYDSTESGTGGYSVGPSNLFTIIDADGTPKNILATDGNTAKVKRSSDLPASRVHDKRTSFNGCSPDQQSEITAAISSAKSYASDAYSYIAGISSGTTRYTTWFGEYDQNHKDKVEEHFRLISNSPFEGFFYDCYTCNSLDAFTVVAPPTGTDSKAGTLINAASRFRGNGGNHDIVLGQTGCKSLATSDRDSATYNADSYRYFAENNPTLD